jgi:hypothetical protein
MKRVAVMAAVLAGLCAGEAQAATRWAGETHGSVHRANRLASGGVSWDGSFWFRAARDGTIRGQAVVAYEPTIDLGGAHTALGYIRDIGGAAASLLPYGFGTVLGTVGVTQLVGFSVDFKTATAIRRGRLTGRIAGDQVLLRWPGKLKGVPYDLTAIEKAGQDTFASGTAALHDPFKGLAGIKGGFAVHTSQSSSSDDGTSEKIGSYWAAHRVG